MGFCKLETLSFVLLMPSLLEHTAAPHNQRACTAGIPPPLRCVWPSAPAVFERLARAGVAVYSGDVVGHGKSEGHRAYIESYTDTASRTPFCYPSGTLGPSAAAICRLEVFLCLPSAALSRSSAARVLLGYLRGSQVPSLERGFLAAAPKRIARSAAFCHTACRCHLKPVKLCLFSLS